MGMKGFIYRQPTTVEEAVSSLEEFKTTARLKAGGTDLLVRMKKEMVSPKCLINLINIADLNYINYCPEAGLKIGALTTLSEIENSMIVRDRFGVLWKAVSRVASPQIRNRATLGGNICLDSRCQYYNQSKQWLSSLEPCYKRKGNRCHLSRDGDRCSSVFSADTVPALIALGAKIRLLNFERERTVLLEEFYTGAGMKVNRMRPNEMLTEVQIPEMEERTSGVYLKVSERDEVDFPILGAAILVFSNGEGIAKKVSIVIIGIQSGPIRLSKVEEMLVGEKLESGNVQEVCRHIPDMIPAISNALGLAGYKRRILPSLVAQGLMDATASR